MTHLARRLRAAWQGLRHALSGHGPAHWRGEVGIPHEGTQEALTEDPPTDGHHAAEICH